MTTSVSRIPTLYINNRKSSSSAGNGGRRRSNSCTNSHRYTSEIISLDAIDQVDLERLSRKKRHRSAHSRHGTETRQSSVRSRDYTKCRTTRDSELVTCDNGTFPLRCDLNGNADSSSSDDNERTGGLNRVYELTEKLSAVKHTFESLKQIVKSNQPPPSGVLSRPNLHLKQHMEIRDSNGNSRVETKINDNTRNINTRSRLNNNETATKIVDVKRSLVNTRSVAVDNETSSSRLKNINKEVLLQISGGPSSKLTSPAMSTDNKVNELSSSSGASSNLYQNPVPAKHEFAMWNSVGPTVNRLSNSTSFKSAC
ncbi:hypothetical protein WDU94_007314 [Cyamophila willieti]